MVLEVCWFGLDSYLSMSDTRMTASCYLGFVRPETLSPRGTLCRCSCVENHHPLIMFEEES